MYAAFFKSACQDSQVILAFDKGQEFVRDRITAVVSTKLPASGSSSAGTTHWVGFSSCRKRAWGMQGSTTNGVLPIGIADSIRKAGCLFLDSTRGAVEGLSEMKDLAGIDTSRIFAFDGRHAAILVTEDRTRVFCQQISAGLYDLGVSTEPRPDWQDILDVAASSLSTDGHGSSARGAVGGMEPLFKALPLWASVVHLAPHRVSIHQRSADGVTDGVAFQHSLINGDGGLVSTGKEEMYHNSVQDAFVIFNTHPSGSTRFIEQSRALTSGHTRSSEARRMVPKKTSPPRRRRKDPNRPRGYVSAFNFFVKDKRSAYVRDAQGFSPGNNNEVNKKLGQAWKELTTEEKNCYQARSDVDKCRYLKKRASTAVVEDEGAMQCLDLDQQQTEGGFCRWCTSTIDLDEVAEYTPPVGGSRIHPRIHPVHRGVKRTGNADADKETGRPSPAYTHFTNQETIGVRCSKSTAAKSLMSKTFGQRWSGGRQFSRMPHEDNFGDPGAKDKCRMPDEEKELYKELEEADKTFYNTTA